ncbi:hypothetical protein [Nocardia sp. NBC_01327]|uniref:hypothetical protein n=1 Tax=Nocardia sp. NBC_01327 TaxID=2903593 RepID=UPI002E0FAD4C|nr:hypothetical protein OG326_33625 [Nocardia sp. NBC_01327]
MSEHAALEAYWPASVLLKDWSQLLVKLSDRFKEAHQHDPGPGEVEAWRTSVYELATILDSMGLGQVWMFI